VPAGRPKKKLKAIRNNSGVAQSVMYGGKKITIGPNEERSYVAELADHIIGECAGIVVEVTDDFGASYVEDPTNTIWIANMTGDPDAPNEVTVKEVQNKKWIDVQIPNPRKHARDVKEWAEGPMVEYTAKDGVLEALNMPGKYITIPPYKRIELDAGMGRWFMERVAMSARRTVDRQDLRLACVSRAPGKFEPSMDWPLDEMRAYLTFADAHAKQVPSEAELRKASKPSELDDVLDDAKRMTMKRIYFRLVNPKCRLPTRQNLRQLVDDEAKKARKKALLEKSESDQQSAAA
jgi:hypothetical protein